MTTTNALRPTTTTVELQHRGSRRRHRIAAAGRQLQHLPDAAHHAAAEPGSAQSARYQSVHPAARRVRLRRAAGQHEHQPANPDLNAADLGSDLGDAIGRRQCHISSNTATLSKRPARPAAWGFTSPSPATGKDHHHQLDRTGRLHRDHVAQCRQPDLHLEWPGQ